MTKNITVSIPDWVYYEIWQKIPHGSKSAFVEKLLIDSRHEIEDLESNRETDIGKELARALAEASE